MLLVQGMTIAEAADTLGVALCTAKTHLAGLIRQDRREAPADLVRIAMGAPRRGSEPRMTWQLPHCQTPELSISIVYVKFSAQGLTMTIASPNASTAEAGHDHVHVFVEAMKL